VTDFFFISQNQMPRGSKSTARAPVGRPPKTTTAANAIARNQGTRYAISSKFQGKPTNARVTLIPKNSTVANPTAGVHAPTGRSPTFVTVQQHFATKK
jgi:hypothetical protein